MSSNLPVSPPEISRARVVVSALAVAGTLPYLILKVLWLSGSRVGLLDPEFGRSVTMHVANAATFAMDAVAVVLAVAFASRLADRIPTPALLAPLWVGTGLLAPIVVIVPLQLLLGVPQTSGSGSEAIAGWVYALVYAGFLWQGVFLLLAFGLFARARWGSVARTPVPRAPWSLSSTVACILLVTAAVLLVADAAAHAPIAWPNLLGDAAAPLVAVLGLMLLHRGAGPRWRPVVATWVGSGATFAWGLYQLVLVTVPNDLVTGETGVLDVATQVVRVAAGLTTLLAAGQAAARERRSAARPTRKITRPTEARATPTRLVGR